jgi:hypothetical protein
MPLAGLVVNRVHPAGATGLSSGRALSAADALPEGSVTSGLLQLHARRLDLGAREEQLTGRFTGAHPDVPLVRVAAQPEDVHDLAGLRRVGSDLRAAARATTVPRRTAAPPR